MSNVDTPPNPYFGGINFNPSFFLSVASNYLTEAIANSKYLRLIGGILTDNLGIKTTPQVELDVNGKAIINNNAGSSPGVGTLGSSGTRLILFPGSATITPFALGCDTDTLWYGSAAIHSFYTGTTERLRINGSGNVGIGTTNPDTYRCRIRGSANNTFLRIETPNDLASEVTGIDFGIPAYTSTSCAKITSTTFENFTNIFQFHTSAGEFTSAPKLTIRGNGNIGIGTSDSDSKLQILTDSTAGVTTNVFNFKNSANYGIYATSINIASRGNTLSFLSRDFDSGANTIRNILSLRPEGNVGIGTDDPDTYRLRIRGSSNNTFLRIETPNNEADEISGIQFGIPFYTSNTCAIIISKTYPSVVNDLQFHTASGANTSSAKMVILGNGYVGIAKTDPGNILQVGDGGRLRISNSSADYTLIGTKETDDTNNTCIEIYGNTYSGFSGKISYSATTATGEYLFYFNGNNAIAILAYDNVKFYKSPRAISCNYENDGQSFSYQTLINVGGTSLDGYFIPVQKYTSSIMICSFSHNSTVYFYWGGHITIGNNNQILNITAHINSSNLLVESFTQQTTLLYFIRVKPTISFQTFVAVKAKIYG